MVIEKRYYQEEAKNAVLDEWKNGNNKTLIVLPTAAGKTIIFTDILKTVADKDNRALVLAHTGELLDQAIEKIEKFSDLKTSLEKAKSTAIESDTPVVVGSIQTISRDDRLTKYPPDYFKYIVIDEAHHSMSDSYKKVLNYFDSAKILGVTATPNRGDHKELAEFYNSKAYEYEFRQAIADGYLCPIKTQTIPLNIDISDVKMQSGDFAASEIGDTLESYLVQIAEEIKNRCKDRKTVVFLPLVKTSQVFCKILNDIGVPAVEINGKTSNRNEILDDFKNGKYKVICNAMLLTEGWDCPDVDCIIVLRPTRSDALYRQMVGRGCRLAEGKTNLLLLDFLWLTKKFNVMHPANLIGKNDEIIKRMTKKASDTLEEDDLFDLEEDAIRDYERDIEEKLKKELEASSKKSAYEKRLETAVAQLIPFGQLFKNNDLLLYDHCYHWEYAKPSLAQQNTLINMGVSKSTVSLLTKGTASALLNVLIERRKSDLCTYKQAKYLSKYKIDVSKLSFKAASAIITKIIDADKTKKKK